MNLKAAILGAGYMGKCHGENLMKFGVEISAVCDEREEARQSFKKHINRDDVAEFSNFDSMLDDSRFDILFICLPPFAQCGQFQKAAAKGKHIFIEKPVALTAIEGIAMVKAAAAAGVITQVGFHMRWGTAVKKLVEIVKSEDAGRPVLFNGQYECNSLHTPWWIDADLSGGQVLEQAIHLYDMSRHLMGHPEFVSGVMGNVCHSHITGYTVEDVSASVAKLPNGSVSTISATNCAVPGLWEGKFTVVFEKVTVFFETPNKACFVFTQGDNVRYEYINGKADMKLDEVKDFIEAVINKRESGCSINEGYLSLCYVEAVVNSAGMDGKRMNVAHL